jgi:DNA polymerase (family 10)
MPPRNQDIADLLLAIADLLEIRGDNRFRVGAYRDAARRIAALTDDLATIAAEGRLRTIPGIGEAIAGKVQEFLETGRLAYYDRLRQEVPETLRELLEIPGLGPRKVRLLYERLGVRTIADLRRALADGRVAQLPGMGEKSVQHLQWELERRERRGRRIALGTALPLAEQIAGGLRAAAGPAARVEVVGSIRRWCETVGDLNLLASGAEAPVLLDAFVRLPFVGEVIARAETSASVLTAQGEKADLRVVPPSAWGNGLQYLTGSRAHNARLDQLAEQKGLRLGERGLIDVRDGRVLPAETEEEVYRRLGLLWVPPELREDSGEIEAARDGCLPSLVTVADIRGDLHCHSNWSDGTASIEEMWAAARARGYAYLALTDHSQSLGIAHGLTVDRLREQRAIIEAINRRGVEPYLLHGVELEIRSDGSLDFPDDVLAELDIVIASVHGGFGQPREKMTARLIAAARNPHVDIIGHPTGRLIGRREGYDVDLDALMEVCAETGTALEINANPARLDLEGMHARRAVEKGVLLVINTDAHAPDNLDLLRFGIFTARRGWVSARQVLNSRPLEELLAYLKRRGRPRPADSAAGEAGR